MDTEETKKIECSPLGCREIEDLLDAFIDDELPHTTSRSFTAHLEGCAACSELLSDMRAILDTAKTLSRQTMPQPARSRLRVALNEKFGLQLDPEPSRLRLVKNG